MMKHKFKNWHEFAESISGHDIPSRYGKTLIVGNADGKDTEVTFYDPHGTCWMSSLGAFGDTVDDAVESMIQGGYRLDDKRPSRKT